MMNYEKNITKFGKKLKIVSKKNLRYIQYTIYSIQWKISKSENKFFTIIKYHKKVLSILVYQ